MNHTKNLNYKEIITIFIDFCILQVVENAIKPKLNKTSDYKHNSLWYAFSFPWIEVRVGKVSKCECTVCTFMMTQSCYLHNRDDFMLKYLSGCATVKKEKHWLFNDLMIRWVCNTLYITNSWSDPLKKRITLRNIQYVKCMCVISQI